MKKTSKKGQKTLAELDAVTATPTAQVEEKKASVSPITAAELRYFLQPAAEKKLQLELNAKLQGRGNPLPLKMEGHRGLGKTSLGLTKVSEMMEKRGWTIEKSPFPTEAPISESAALTWLGKLCQANTLTVIVWDEAENFPWPAFKKLIEDESPNEFPFKGKEGIENAVYNPHMFTWLLASNFSVDNGERGAGESRTVPIPFLPLNSADKLVLWKRYADSFGLTYTDASAEMGARNCLPIGRDMKKEVRELATFQRHMEGVCDLSKPNDLREALIQLNYSPGGLTEAHVTVLSFLATAPQKRNGESYGYQCQDIRNQCLAGRDESETLAGLTAAGYVITSNSSRKRITESGMEYLDGLADYKESEADAIGRQVMTLDAWRDWKETQDKPATVKPAKKAAKKKGA